MDCNCNKKRKAVIHRPTRNQQAPQAPKAAPVTSQTHKGVEFVNSFCKVCGWMLKKIKYIDVNTNSIVERTDCTNPKCQTRK